MRGNVKTGTYLFRHIIENLYYFTYRLRRLDQKGVFGSVEFQFEDLLDTVASEFHRHT